MKISKNTNIYKAPDKEPGLVHVDRKSMDPKMLRLKQYKLNITIAYGMLTYGIPIRDCNVPAISGGSKQYTSLNRTNYIPEV